LNFRDARLKLLAYVRNEVRNGELTERRLARLIGISQPHAHNVLKGVRTLSPEVFDLVLKYLHLSLLDLASTEELEAQLHRRHATGAVAEFPFLETPLGPGRAWPAHVDWRRTFSAPLYPPLISDDLVMAKLERDPDMSETLNSVDIALLDISRDRLSAISPQGLYVVERRGETLLRYIRRGAHRDYLVTDSALNRPVAWEPVSFSAASAVIRARVVWLGREADRDAAVQRGRLLYNPISS
jgi:transcriptional regulator with XRE-family HTH domain